MTGKRLPAKPFCCAFKLILQGLGASIVVERELAGLAGLAELAGLAGLAELAGF